MKKILVGSIVCLSFIFGTFAPLSFLSNFSSNSSSYLAKVEAKKKSKKKKKKKKKSKKSNSNTNSTTNSQTFSCSGKTVCSQMTSCNEAKFYLNTCGVSSLDGDKDGIPCESICN